MSYFVLGFALLVAFLLAGRWFVTAEPKTIIKVLKYAFFGLIGVIVLFFLLTGRFVWALYALPALLPWFFRARAMARTAKNFSRMAGGTQGGMSSEVESAYLTMTLDHDSGDMDGIVRKGRYEGGRLSDMSLEDLLTLYDDYASDDGESARLLAAFLDRNHPDWHGGEAHTEEATGQSAPPPPGGQMSPAEARRVLGVDESASEKEIKAAYHRLIANLHPDKGGSAYLAAKINEARDVLIGT